jgi:hypothetical protein
LKALYPLTSPDANVQTSMWDGYSYQQVIVEQGSSSGSCPLCFGGLSFPLRTDKRVAFVLDLPCT